MCFLCTFERFIGGYKMELNSSTFLHHCLLRHSGNEPAPLGSLGKGPPLLCCIIAKNCQWPFVITEVTGVDREHWSDKERRVQIGMWEEKKFRETSRTSIVKEMKAERRQHELNDRTEKEEEWHRLWWTLSTRCGGLYCLYRCCTGQPESKELQ